MKPLETGRAGSALSKELSTSKSLNPRRLVRQTVFCDPQIPRYSAVLESSSPASQQRLEAFRGTQPLRN